VRAITGLPGSTRLEYAGNRQVYTLDWGKEKIAIVDLNSMSVIKRLATEVKPNGSSYVGELVNGDPVNLRATFITLHLLQCFLHSARQKVKHRRRFAPARNSYASLTNA
jgi:hypothetical protein